MQKKYSIYLRHISELVTCSDKGKKPKAGPGILDIGAIKDGAVLVEGDRISRVGTTADLDSYIAEAKGEAFIEREFDLSGMTVAPGFVDPHTHLVFSGSRENEFAMRVAGKTYLEIQAAGGGILSTIGHVRGASEEDLYRQAYARAESAFMHGTTSMEIKSGYCLDLEGEIKSLRVINKLAKDSKCTIVPTYMGAHAIPPEYKQSRGEYIELVAEKVIPRVAAEKLAKYNDVFVEEGAFTADEGRRILEAGKKHGLIPKVHADEITSCGGAELAAEVGAASADHLLMATASGLLRMRDEGVVAVCLPGTLYSLLSKSYLGFDKLLNLAIPAALATDANPGSNMCLNMQTAINQAVCLMKTPVAAALNMATINAAYAIGLADERGSIEEGKFADMIVLEGASHEYFAYCYGTNLVRYVVKNGSMYKVNAELSKI